MRAQVYAFTIGLALVATAGLALLAFRERPAENEHELPGGETPPAAGDPVDRTATIRPYQTTVTLAEDLRDALAGAKDELAPECWRVSLALGPTARWTLLHVARDEASPRVRALIVLAAGVHAPDEAVLLESIEDEWPIVRRAAVLATGYAKGGDAKTSQGRELLDGLTVPLGRTIPEETARVLRQRLGREKDAAVRADIASVLSR